MYSHISVSGQIKMFRLLRLVFYRVSNNSNNTQNRFNLKVFKHCTFLKFNHIDKNSIWKKLLNTQEMLK